MVNNYIVRLHRKYFNKKLLKCLHVTKKSRTFANVILKTIFLP
jgi:hypothetical protein